MKKELAAWIEQQKRGKTTLTIGISGAQGTGKSTLAQALKALLSDKYAVALLSLDDFYFNQQQRAKLARDIHPLFQTRGVPGTHDVSLGIQILRQLKKGEGEVLLPRFDKQTDNPKPKSMWERCMTPVDIVLFEGWCLGLRPQAPHALVQPINALEATEDKEGVWRKQVNDALAGEYQTWFQEIDKLIYLKAPGMASIFSWRKQQEQETFAHQPASAMDDHTLYRFLAHYERLTRHSLATMPHVADVVLTLNEQHQCISCLHRHEAKG